MRMSGNTPRSRTVATRPSNATGGPFDEWLDQFLPHLSIDCVVFGFHDADLELLLLKWKGHNVWALPGGYVGRRQSLDDAAQWVLRQRTGLRQVQLRQFHAFGELGRGETMARKALGVVFNGVRRDQWVFQRVVSIGYCALVDFHEAEPTPAANTDSCAWYPLNDHPPLAFDHERIVARALEELRSAVEVPGAGASLLPERFTMPELQRLHEAILGRRLDRRNFQKKMLERGGIERLSERREGGAHRAPYLYRFTVLPYHADF
jgi:8-oxo-dGTP diphosphatase